MKKYLKKLLIISFCLIFIFILANNVLAFTDTYKDFLRIGGEVGTYKVEEQGTPQFIDTKIGEILTVIISFIGILFLGLIIYSGFQWMTAGGNEEKVSSAKKRVINGTIGVGITLLAFIATNVLFTYFNNKFLSPAYEEEQPPPGYEEIACETEAQCADQPILKHCNTHEGRCVQCIINTYPCPDGYECQDDSMCYPSGYGGACTTLNNEQCLFNNDCIWLNPGVRNGEPSCVNVDDDPCGRQCPDDAPVCLEGTGCVQCISQADCSGWPIFRWANRCNDQNICDFGP